MAILLPRRPTTRKGDQPMKKALSMLLGLALLIALTILTAGPVLAQTVLGPVRCGTQLVQVGDTKDQILAKCGQPTTTDPGRRGGGEIWYYDGSSGNFNGLLRFTGPQLTSIERK
jgi:outer membrane protein assembly factor BamE (lipoprotein component of BamABCDE complex)